MDNSLKTGGRAVPCLPHIPEQPDGVHGVMHPTGYVRVLYIFQDLILVWLFAQIAFNDAA